MHFKSFGNDLKLLLYYIRLFLFLVIFLHSYVGCGGGDNNSETESSTNNNQQYIIATDIDETIFLKGNLIHKSYFNSQFQNGLSISSTYMDEKGILFSIEPSIKISYSITIDIFLNNNQISSFSNSPDGKIEEITIYHFNKDKEIAPPLVIPFNVSSPIISFDTSEFSTFWVISNPHTLQCDWNNASINMCQDLQESLEKISKIEDYSKLGCMFMKGFWKSVEYFLTYIDYYLSSELLRIWLSDENREKVTFDKKYFDGCDNPNFNKGTCQGKTIEQSEYWKKVAQNRSNMEYEKLKKNCQSKNGKIDEEKTINHMSSEKGINLYSLVTKGDYLLSEDKIIYNIFMRAEDRMDFNPGNSTPYSSIGCSIEVKDDWALWLQSNCSGKSNRYKDFNYYSNIDSFSFNKQIPDSCRENDGDNGGNDDGGDDGGGNGGDDGGGNGGDDGGGNGGGNGGDDGNGNGGDDGGGNGGDDGNGNGGDDGGNDGDGGDDSDDGQGKGGSGGDPHLFTIDGLYFDNQFIGEFVLCRDKSNNEFEVQVRQQRLEGLSRCVTFNTDAAIRFNSNVIEYQSNNNIILIDGIITNINEGNYLYINKECKLKRQNGINCYSSSGVEVIIRDYGSYLNVNVNVSSAFKNNIEGLLGNFDENLKNELQLRNGEQAINISDFIVNWRLKDEESLLTYADGFSTNSYSGIQDCTLNITQNDLETIKSLCLSQFGIDMCTDDFVYAIAKDISAGMSNEQVFEWINDMKKDCSSQLVSNQNIKYISTFDNDDEGWRFVNDVVLSWKSSGGNIGGFLQGNDKRKGITWYFVSPQSWAGDWSSFDTLSYDFKLIDTGGGDIGKMSTLKIKGVNEHEMNYSEQYDNYPNNTWKTYNIELKPDSFNVTEDEFYSIMKNVKEIWIRGEYSDKFDIEGIDNVIIVSNKFISVSKSLTVNAKANIFGAGKSIQIEDGISPPYINFSSHPEQYIIFTNVNGEVSEKKGEAPYNNADGGDYGSTNISSYDGISGIIAANRCLFLVGMFADDTEPTEPSPVRLEYNTYDFIEIAPELNQIFFIGDGLTGNDLGALQKFNIPSKATRLFLGFADAYIFQGEPCCYYDNDGILNTTFEIITAKDRISGSR